MESAENFAILTIYVEVFARPTFVRKDDTTMLGGGTCGDWDSGHLFRRSSGTIQPGWGDERIG
jgi:hypothetical protein